MKDLKVTFGKLGSISPLERRADNNVSTSRRKQNAATFNNAANSNNMKKIKTGTPNAAAVSACIVSDPLLITEKNCPARLNAVGGEESCIQKQGAAGCNGAGARQKSALIRRTQEMNAYFIGAPLFMSFLKYSEFRDPQTLSETDFLRFWTKPGLNIFVRRGFEFELTFAGLTRASLRSQAFQVFVELIGAGVLRKQVVTLSEEPTQLQRVGACSVHGWFVETIKLTKAGEYSHIERTQGSRRQA